MKLILCSACLLGLKTKYDGTHNCNKEIMKLSESCILIPVCPEQLGGLSTPRERALIKGEEIITESGKNVTKYYAKGAREVLKIAKMFNIKEAILKQRSPSCGCGQIYEYNKDFEIKKIIKGDGMTTRILKENGIKILSEEAFNQGFTK